MATVQNNFPKDGNSVAITYGGLITTDSQTFTGNNNTFALPIFTVTGAIEVTALYGIITTDLSSNITAAYWRTNDASTQNAITLATGTTLSSAVDGGMISKKAGVGTALTLTAGTSGQVIENATAGAVTFQDFVILANPDATTNIEFVYTCNNQSSGAITFYLRWAPLATANNGQLGGNVTAL